ncbi:DMT family transporter [Janthinobacterium fluminis]|uniref:DMT family transporter n=1 Tax=Janthinobacterium fluminis TaxID=2987524 RepID=A0ABT5K3J1_9BURK|nr:DMT family transporter [Janthinobacterium fluminis]MDC8759541.1 DMT family transporter [Janthinobacterium fluminis]
MHNLFALLALPIALVAGAVVPLQAGANGALGRALGHPLWASVVSLGVSAIVAVTVMLVLRVPAPDFALAARGPAWGWLGGVAGVFYLTAALILAPRLGSGPFMAAVIAGQMLASLALDRYGWFGFAAKAATPPQLLGAALIIAGVISMQWPAAAGLAAKTA